MRQMSYAISIITVLAVAMLTGGCSREEAPTQTGSSQNQGPIGPGGAPPPPIDPLTLSCAGATLNSISINACAGPSGAPGGFQVQFMKYADYLNLGWSNPCVRVFNGNANSNYSLGPNACVVVTISALPNPDPNNPCETALEECTAYIFRARPLGAGAGNTNWSNELQCTTECPQCTYSQGYWKNHADVWPVQSLMLGTTSYTKAQLLDIFNTPVQGNGLISLSHQLIAAKLNIANGASASAVAATILSADALIGALIVPPVGSGWLDPATTGSLTQILDDYNNGVIGPGHCP